MARIIIHTGAYETGALSLQAFFKANVDALARQNVIYPSFEEAQTADVLAAVWLPQLARRMETSSQDARQFWRRLIDDVAGTDRTLFVSAEALSRVAPERVDFRDLASMTADVADVELVYVMREQASFLQSIFVRTGRTQLNPPSLQSMVSRAFSAGAPTGVTLNHGAIFDLISEGFPAQKIRFLEYDSLSAAPGGAIGWFLRHCGASDDLSLYQQPKERNAALDPLSYLHATNMAQTTKKRDAIALLVREVIEELHGPDIKTSLLTGDEVERLRKRYAALNKELFQKVSLRDPMFRRLEVGFRDDVLYRDKVGPDFWRALAHKLGEEGRFPHLYGVTEG